MLNICNYKIDTLETDMVKKIDIVYLWVDGSDADWAKQKNIWFERVFGIGKTYKSAGAVERFRDNDELKYSLRSVAENVPWINHIYIVTGFGQVPNWLNTKNPKITIISHEQIMPKSSLPTFNSSAILMCIHNIPGLSEHFLLSDDDMFFNKKVKPSYFYDKHGRSIVNYNKHHGFIKDISKWRSSVDEYTKSLINAAQLVKDVCGKTVYIARPSHGIDPYIKSSMKECISNSLIKNKVDETINYKFRNENEISRWLFNLYDYMTNRAVMKHCHPYKSKHFLDFIYNAIHWYSIRRSPVFCEDAFVLQKSIKHSVCFCINDSYKSGETVLKHNADFLQNRFPNKSEFEK